MAAHDTPAGAGRPPSTRVVLPDGRHARDALSDDAQVVMWGLCVLADAPGRVELAAGRRMPDGTLRMRSRSDPRRFPFARDRGALVELVRRHREAGDEVFCTPLTRRRAHPGREGEILPGAVVWIDIDDPGGLELLRGCTRRPHLVVYSGSGGAHSYWRLERAQPPEAIEVANRKLAAHLGGDLSSTDRARVMRVAGSMNWKAGRPCLLAYANLAEPPFALERLVAGLPDPAPPPPPPDPETLRRRAERNALDDARRLPPPIYFRLLAGVEVPERGGDIRCPLPDHDEQNPSCRVYPTGEQGWVCFGCRRGGSIYDLASLLDGGPGGRRGALHGEEFKRVKRRVWDLLGLAH